MICDKSYLNEEIKTSFEAFLPAVLEAQVWPRLREILNEVLDERLPGVHRSTPTTSKDGGSSLAISRRRTGTGTGTALSQCDKCDRDHGIAQATTTIRFSELSGFSAMVAPEDSDVLACSSSAWVLHPNSWTRWIWDSLALLMFVVDVVYTTFEWAFLSGDTAALERSRWLVMADVLTGTFWTADLCVNFCTGYLDNSTCLVEQRPLAAAKHYLCTWFFIDFFASAKLLPSLVAYLFELEDGNQTSTKLLALLRVLKLTKLFRVAKLNILRRRLAQLETRTQSKVIICVLCIFQLVSVLLTASHVFACVLWAVAQQSVRDGNVQESWLWTSPHPDLANSSSLRQKYMASMHLSVSIMTGMGTGEVTTALPSEEMLFCAFYLVSLALVGVIVNEVAVMYTKLSETSAEISHAITCASSFMNWYKVPPGLQLRVERYLQNVFDHKEHTDFRMQLTEWLQASGSLLAELNYSIFGSYLSSHPQLRLLPRDLLAQLANLCESAFFPPNEVVVKPTWKPDRVHWIRSGCMEVVAAAGGHLKGQLARSGTFMTRSPGRIEMVGEGDMLFHRHLLLPSRERSCCTCTCVSFCEVTTLEHTKVIGELTRRSRDSVPVLKVHAAIQEDNAEFLQRALGEDPDTYQSRPLSLLAGETVLHACVRAAAVECIRWLLLTQGWSTDVKDSYGRTPLDLAKMFRHKDIVDTFVLSGAQVSYRHKHPQARPIRRFRQPMAGSMLVATTSEELRGSLARAGVDVTRLGHDGAKTASELLNEMQNGYSDICVSEDGRATRILHVVRVKVSAECGGCTQVLSETEEARWLNTADQVVKLPMKKMRGCDAAAVEEALEILWTKYIGVQASFVSHHLERGVETLYEESKHTGSYPGLDCLFRVHEIPYWVRYPADPACACIGLPNGDVFDVQETLKEGSTKVHVFAWLDLQHPSLEDSTSALAERLTEAGLQLSIPAIQALVQEEESGLSSCIEDFDGKPVRVVSMVRLRIAVVGDDEDSVRVLHEVDRQAPALPAAEVCSGHMERAVGELWRKLLAPSLSPGFAEPGNAVSLASQHFQRGTTTAHVERFTNDQSYPGLRCLNIIYEVPFNVEEARAKRGCAILGLPCPDEAAKSWFPDYQRGLAWLPDGDIPFWF